MEPSPTVHEVRPKRMQFSLRGLLLVTLVASLGLAVWRAAGMLGALLLGVLTIVTVSIVADAHAGRTRRWGKVVRAVAVGGMIFAAWLLALLVALTWWTAIGM